MPVFTENLSVLPANILLTSASSTILSAHKPKMESAEHAASSTAFPGTGLAAPAIAAMKPIALRLFSSLFFYGLNVGGMEDIII